MGFWIDMFNDQGFEPGELKNSKPECPAIKVVLQL
jgi:hypothetical protein